MSASRGRHVGRYTLEWTLLAGASLLVVAAVWAQHSLVNGPQEWEWPYRTPHLHGGWIAALLLSLGLGVVVVGRWGAHLRLTLLTLAGLALSLAVLGAQPGGFERVIRSLVSRHVFSYVFDAGQFATLGETAEAYPEGVARLSMHTRTHPPGPLIGIRVLDRLMPASSDESGGWLVAAREALDEEVRKVRMRRRPVPRHLPSATTVVALALLLPAASALAAVPLFWLAKDEGLGDRGALLAAALWLSVPARTLFTPSLDQAVPVLLLLAAWLAGRPRPLSRLLGGVLLGAATVASYGYLAAAPLVLWPAVSRGSSGAAPSQQPALGPRLGRALVVGVGFALPWLVLMRLGFAPVRAFTAAMAEHRAMVGVERGYATWLLFNPWDFLLFAGAPIVMLAGLDLASIFAGRADTRSARHGLAPVWWLLVLALLLSGTVRGEVGRIWLFLMPFAALFGARALERRSVALGAGALVLQCLILLSLAANLVVVA